MAGETAETGYKPESKFVAHDELVKLGNSVEVGSPPALAISDRWRFLRAGQDIANAQRKLKHSENPLNAQKRTNVETDLIASKLWKKIIGGEIERNKDMVPGYNDFSKDLDRRIDASRKEYREVGMTEDTDSLVVMGTLEDIRKHFKRSA